MPRAPFNDTALVWTSESIPGLPALIGIIDCRLVKVDRIVPSNWPGLWLVGWMTYDPSFPLIAAQPVWVHGSVTIDYTVADRVSVLSDPFNLYAVESIDVVTPEVGPPYARAWLSSFLTDFP